MEKIKKLICSDIMSIRNGNTGSINIVMTGFVFSIIIGTLFSPLLGIFGILIPCGFVNVIFETESKYHSEKLYSILPVNRDDVVKARFISSLVLIFFYSLSTYLLMLLALKIKINTRIMSEDNIDIIQLICETTGGTLSESAFLTIWIVTFIGMSILLSGMQIRLNFKKFISGNTKLGFTKSDIKGLMAFMVILTIFLIICITGNIGPVLTIITTLLSKLLSFSGGLFYSVIVLSVSIITYYYNFACTLLEYNSREL